MALLSSAAVHLSVGHASSLLPYVLFPGRRSSPNPKLPASCALRRDGLRKPLFSSSELGALAKRCGLRAGFSTASSHLCEQERPVFDMSSLSIEEAVSDDVLWAAVRLRVRTFYRFNESYGIEDYETDIAKREFEGLKDRIAGKTTEYKKVACINVTVPLLTFGGFADELCSVCKCLRNGEDHVVVGTLDVNWCLQLPDELTGKRPEGVGVDLTRAYLSNICVAKEMQRNGLGYALIAYSKKVVRTWGITDLYVHVAVDNEAAKKLYDKSGFSYESEEPAWRARFLGRPRRYLLWTDLVELGVSLFSLIPFRIEYQLKSFV